MILAAASVVGAVATLRSLSIVIAVIFVALLIAFTYIGFGVMSYRDHGDDVQIIGGEASLRSHQLRQPFVQRAVAPLVAKFGDLFARFTPESWLERTSKLLAQAGRPLDLDPSGWLVVRVIAMLAAVLIWALLFPSLDGLLRVLTFPLLLAAGLLGPEAVLRHGSAARMQEMGRSLPDVLDLLVISVEAGLGFDAALDRVARTVPGALAEEFGRMLAETRMGVSRRDAMKHLSARIDLDDLRSFLLAMIQADTFGVSVSRVLRVQSEEMRTRRRQHAQERAFAAPVKMIFPLVFCVFPALFTVLLGPAAIQIFQALVDLPTGG